MSSDPNCTPKIKQEYPPGCYGGQVGGGGMAGSNLWNGQAQLPQEQLEQLTSVYTAPISLELRSQLSDWIHSKFAPYGLLQPPQCDPQNVPEHLQIATSIGTEMLTVVSRTNPQECENLKLSFSTPAELYMAVRGCLEQEIIIMSQVPDLQAAYGAGGAFAGGGGGDGGEEARKDREIKQQLGYLNQRIEETGAQLAHYQQQQEKFTSDYWNFRQRCNHYDQMVKEKGEADQSVLKFKQEQEKLCPVINNMYTQLNHDANVLLGMMGELFNDVKKVQAVVLDQEVIGWKQSLHLAGNGFKIDATKIDRLQVWCEGLAKLIWDMRKQLKTLEGLRNKITGDNAQQQTGAGSTQQIQILLNNITELLSNLVTGTFVIEKQPPQVMKTNTRFGATVRLLVGGALNVHMGAPSVSVSIVNETQVNQLLSQASQLPKRKEDYACGDILNNQGTMEFHSTTRQVSCAFRNLQLRKIKRTEKKGQESVMDEKFAVLFWTDFQVGELKFQLWTFSLPVVVIVHGNQESQALSTIVWDNGFGDWGRNAFVVAEKVPWKKMGEVLSMKWQAACGAGLTEENLYFLACKALRNNNLSRNEYNNVPISWQYFCKELLPDRTFTFWEWFYRAMELTQLRLMNLWKDRHIMGFVDKGAAQQILMAKSVGSFLLRFSDSELGGITIAFKQQTNFGEFSVESLFPFSKRDLEQRSMAEIVFDIDNLLYVVGSSHGEEIPKDKLKNYLVPSPRPNEAAGKCNPGYIKTVFKTHMEGGGPNPIYSNINSPPQHTETDFEKALLEFETQEMPNPHAMNTDFPGLEFESMSDQIDVNIFGGNFGGSFGGAT